MSDKENAPELPIESKPIKKAVLSEADQKVAKLKSDLKSNQAIVQKGNKVQVIPLATWKLRSQPFQKQGYTQVK